jgi:hypothetical protein
MTILFFVYFGTHNNKIDTIYKQTRVFVYSFFPCCCFAFISKQQQQKNLHFIIRSQYAMVGPCVKYIIDCISHYMEQCFLQNFLNLKKMKKKTR